ncbi:MAG: hypothetical protein KDB03_09475 [Planctomycetales bacterium]|nr:hypothetical protein [Planctomycetales bacterium]
MHIKLEPQDGSSWVTNGERRAGLKATIRRSQNDISNGLNDSLRLLSVDATSCATETPSDAAVPWTSVTSDELDLQLIKANRAALTRSCVGDELCVSEK